MSSSKLLRIFRKTVSDHPKIQYVYLLVYFLALNKCGLLNIGVRFLGKNTLRNLKCFPLYKEFYIEKY